MLKMFDPKEQIDLIHEQLRKRDRELQESKTGRLALSVAVRVRDRLVAASAEASQLPVLLKRMRGMLKKDGVVEKMDEALALEEEVKNILKMLDNDAKFVERFVEGLADFESEFVGDV